MNSPKQGPDRMPVVMAGAQAAEKFGIEEAQAHTCEGTNKILVWEGDLSWSGKMDMDGDGESSGTIVTGNLTVDGDVANWEMDYGNFLWVGGNLKCRHLVNGGGEVYVRGNVEATGIVLAHGNNGFLTVDGVIAKAQALIRNDFHEVGVNVAPGVRVADDGDGVMGHDGEEIDYEDTTEVLIDEVMEENDDEDEPADIDWPALKARMEAGKTVLRKK